MHGPRVAAPPPGRRDNNRNETLKTYLDAGKAAAGLSACDFDRENFRQIGRARKVMRAWLCPMLCGWRVAVNPLMASLASIVFSSYRVSPSELRSVQYLENTVRTKLTNAGTKNPSFHPKRSSAIASVSAGTPGGSTSPNNEDAGRLEDAADVFERRIEFVGGKILRHRMHYDEIGKVIRQRYGVIG